MLSHDRWRWQGLVYDLCSRRHNRVKQVLAHLYVFQKPSKITDVMFLGIKPPRSLSQSSCNRQQTIFIYSHVFYTKFTYLTHVAPSFIKKSQVMEKSQLGAMFPVTGCLLNGLYHRAINRGDVKVVCGVEGGEGGGEEGGGESKKIVIKFMSKSNE